MILLRLKGNSISKMTKRIYIALIPVFVLIFDIINCKTDSSAFNNIQVSAFNISDGGDHNPNTVNLKNKNEHKPQNIYRIKAKQNGAIIIFSPYSSKTFHSVYYVQPFYWNYNSPIFSERFFQYTLRGPPVA
jgi:hypothetical protein